MKLNLKCYLKHAICTLSAYQVCAHMILVACCFNDCKMPTCCFGQFVLLTCLECMCCTVAPFWACFICNLLRIACSFLLSYCILVLSVFAWCLNAFCIAHIGLILMSMNLNLNYIWSMLSVHEVHAKFMLIWFL